MKRLFFVLVVLFFSVFASCVRSKQIFTEVRALGSFTDVVLSGSWNVNIIHGDEHSITIRGRKEEEVRNIVTEVKDNILTVRENTQENSGSLVIFDIQNSDSVYEYDIVLKELQALSMEGSQNIFVKSIETDAFDLQFFGSGDVVITKALVNEFFIRSTGSGNVTLGEVRTRTRMTAEVEGSGDVKIQSGSTEILVLTMGGSGNTDFRNFSGNNIQATNSGTGNMYLWVLNSMNSECSSSGSIHYYSAQSASVAVTESGSGEVKSIGIKEPGN